jgi:hypothetical protein
MSSSPDHAAAAPPRPTIFISYASEDRAAARLLRDALDAAGLDVWYDENELAGGDSWDQKIRRQIRDCEYFMPVISATTQQRKEGYFRREWRLATERSLDMADDVLFLVPVTIDATTENGARVPDKFLTVQWLRLPGGAATPALHHLVRRILSGDHHALTRPPWGANRPPPAAASDPVPEAPPPLKKPAAKPKPADEPLPPMPPMPPFPPVPEKGGFLHGIKFVAEVLWWALTAAWMLFVRAPKWLRIVITVWLVISLFSMRCSRNSQSDSGPPKSAAEKAQTRKVIRAAAEKFARAAKDGDQTGAPGKLAHIGSEIARGFASEMKDADLTGKAIVAVPFALGVANETDAKFLGAVFSPLYGRLAVERADATALVTAALPAATDEALVALGHRLDADFTLGASIARTGDTATLTVRLMKIEDASVAWTGQYPVAGADPSAIADQIATAVLAAVPKEN